MRAAGMLLTVALTLALSGGTAAQVKTETRLVDVSGLWNGEIKTAVSYSPIQISFKLEQTAKGVTGFAWPGEAQVEIKNVKREGNKLSFDISGGNIKYQFDLTASAERLDGDVSATDSGHAWTGKARLDRDTRKQDPKK